jgi:carbon monoxide dehydrogenase subunit G
MHFENRAQVAVARDQLWTYLMDVRNVGECLPGVEDVRELDADTYLGTMRLRVGPISLRFEGSVRVVERKRDQWLAVMQAEGTDRGAGGAVKARIELRLAEAAAETTQLDVVTEASVLGKIGEFGQPVMRKKADSIMQEFATNVSQRAAAAQP